MWLTVRHMGVNRQHTEVLRVSENGQRKFGALGKYIKNRFPENTKELPIISIAS